jgi:transcriptional regulator with PAS, ATPase and Fis domain
MNSQEALREKLGGLIGSSAPMQCIYAFIQKASAFQFPVLILGETGTGKELVARSIHFMGPRRENPIVVVDCAALVPTLVEAELFGFVKGAFTGAFQNKQGLLAAALEGTLFLDEIGDLPTNLQAKLLRVVQENQFRPIGCTAPVPFRARVIAATHHDLQAEVKTGAFREDLYFRLNVLQITLPPLRERKSDIGLLVDSLVEKYAEDGVKRKFSNAAIDYLSRYDWPGNVRELENVVVRSLAMCSEPMIDVRDLSLDVQDAAGEPELPRASRTLAELKRQAIARTLRATAGDKIAAARILGIGKNTIYRRLKQIS